MLGTTVGQFGLLWSSAPSTPPTLLLFKTGLHSASVLSGRTTLPPASRGPVPVTTPACPVPTVLNGASVLSEHATDTRPVAAYSQRARRATTPYIVAWLPLKNVEICRMRGTGNNQPARAVVATLNNKFAALLGAQSFLILVLTWMAEAPLWLGAWPAFAWGAVATGYAGRGADIFAKCDRTGRIPRVRMLILLPYLGLTWLVWRVGIFVSREDEQNVLRPGAIIIGRRPLRRELPTKVASIVDLTCEFDGVVAAPVGYRCVPWLDGAAPRPVELLRAAVDVSELPHPVFIHCAQGHGRTASLAAAVLGVTGVSDSPEHALRTIREARPGAVPNERQRAAIVGAFELMQRRRGTHIARDGSSEAIGEAVISATAR